MDDSGKTSPAVVTAAIALDRLAGTYPDTLAEAVLLVHGGGHVLSPRAARVLGNLGLLDGDGNLLDTAREAVLSWQPRKEDGRG